MSFNKTMTYVCLFLGIIVAGFVGFYLFFVAGMKQILLSSTIANNSIVVNDLVLTLGCLKMLISGFVFWFVLGFFISTARYFAEGINEENF
jgi:hypothetical protein